VTFFEFLEQIIFIIKNLSISFWISVVIISPVFMKFERLVQTGLTKLLYFTFVRFPNRYPKLLKFLGFSNKNMYQELQKLHSQYEKEKNISEKLEISEDFLDETRGGMFVYNELSEIIFGKIIDKPNKNSSSDNNHFNYDLISKMEFNIKELKEINEQKTVKNDKIGNELFNMNERFSSDEIRDEVFREKPKIILPDEFKIAFLAKMKQAESQFLENVEMYLFQKKLSIRWNIFKIIVFIPFMFFLSGLINEVLTFFNVFPD
tara:strand:+ start:330 stop:1115 length:786 start_codon:yes stop_codon:yes gene_type:complete